MQAHTIWEMSRLRAADLRAHAGPVSRRPRRGKVRGAVGVGLVRAGYRLLGAKVA